MNLLGLVWLAIRHPQELKALVNYKLWYDPPNLQEHPEVTRINEPNMQACWTFLDQTSRSFSAVIKELDGELSRVVCIFYLVLRALDTVEDDMSIDIEIKETLLKTFYQKLEQPGWNFDGLWVPPQETKHSPYGSAYEIDLSLLKLILCVLGSPTEKDRNLLVEFDKVISEFQVSDDYHGCDLPDGKGMARFARTAVDGGGVFSIDTMGAFDGYCHYVAGLVGEGLSRLFSESDFREDVDAGRMFWPSIIWKKFVKEPKLLTLPEYQNQAKFALTEITIDTLNHVVDSLEYMTLLKNQSIFNFCAIPQVMAIATIEICFQNLDVFQKNLISKAINPRDLSYIFVDFAHKIHDRADPSDPNYVKLCVVIGRIIAWAENRYPSFITPTNPPPLYSDDPIASNIQDVRVHQTSLTRNRLNPPSALAVKPKMGLDDLKFVLIIVSSVLALILTVSAILGSLVYLATKKPDTSILNFTLPLTSWRIEL
ncbi:hypothetical protein H4Q26_001053 [Puccinia striiformis f. sp. tritici PST-130]|nr:hypothetical protein H4Q26_001053 [Puccinia striiformis f. sp. tritici PST-130]